MPLPFTNKRFVTSAVLVATVTGFTGISTVQAQTATGTPAAQTARRSSLPDEALAKAREAEQQLAANQPDKAIEILRELDKKHPGNAAISLRLAQIYDTADRNGHALFYYRRYIQQAGPRAREMAVERVTSLEMMVGIDDDAEAAAQEIGETTRPIATPTPQVRRMLATEAKDGSLIPINSEEDFLKYQRQGVPQSAPATPVPTASPAIVIPAELSATPVNAVRRPESPADNPDASPTAPTTQPTRAARTQISVYSDATPRPPDEDALLANAFRKADSAEQITASVEKQANNPQKVVPEAKPEKTEPSPKKVIATKAAPSAASATPRPSATPPPPAMATPVATQQTIAYTRQTPAHESARAASFFNITQGNSSQATIVVRNELKSAIVTVSIIPEDASEAHSAILMPGESKSLTVPPARYDVTANAATTDYSPITLMSTEFKYTFHGNRQYTRRFNDSSLQRVD